MAQPIYVGYIRWSSDAQEDGDSERRQRNSITVDAARLGLTITRWLQDEGLSASSGENISKGELGRFLAEVRAGQVPRGSILFLDEATRLTRLSPSKAMRILADLEDAGVTIRLSARGQSMSGDGLYELLGFLVESAAGHAFTKELGRKVHEAWLAKRDGARKAPGKEVLTSNTPYGIVAAGGAYTIGKGWSGRHYELHPREAPVVVLIFELARDGHSPRQIAVKLNTQNVPSPHASRGKKAKGGRCIWRTETVRDILRDRVYLDGSYQPCRGTSKTGKAKEGDRVVGHYPVLLSEKGLWEAANAEISKRYSARPAPHTSGAANLFTGLMKCAHCQGPISLRSGNDRGRMPTLYCTNARDGACISTKSVHRHLVEGAVLLSLANWLNPELILKDLDRAELVVDHEATLQRLQVELREREKEVVRLADRVLQLSNSENADLYEERLTKARRERDELRQRTVAAERQRDLAAAERTQQLRAATDFQGLLDAVVGAEPRTEISEPLDVAAFQQELPDVDRTEATRDEAIEAARVRLKAALRRLVGRIEFNLATGQFNIELQGLGLVCCGLSEEDDEGLNRVFTSLMRPGLKVPKGIFSEPLRVKRMAK